MSHSYLIHYYTTKLFKCISDIRKKVPKLSTDKEILLWGNRMMLSSVIYHGWEQPHCGHYISGVQKDDTPFWITDTRIIKQQKLYCSSKDNGVPYVLIYENLTNFLTVLPNLLNGTAEVDLTSRLITETAETMIWQSVF